MIRKPKKKKRHPYVNLSELYVEAIRGYDDIGTDMDRIAQAQATRTAAPSVPSPVPPTSAHAQSPTTPQPQQPVTTSNNSVNDLVQAVQQSKNEYVHNILREWPGGDLTKLCGVGGISLPPSSGVIDIQPNDRQVWKLLYRLSPPKANEPGTSTKGSGNGELAAFWFLYLPILKQQGLEAADKFIIDNRHAGKGAPDLLVNGVGLEVKAYGGKEKAITIGKFKTAGTETEYDVNNKLANYIFGFNALFNELNVSPKMPVQEMFSRLAIKSMAEGKAKKTSTPVSNSHLPTLGSFKGEDVSKALEALQPVAKVFGSAEFQEIVNVWGFQIFKDIDNKIKFIYNTLGEGLGQGEQSAEGYAKSFLRRLLSAKLSVKPGNNGYILDCDREGGSLRFYRIDLAQIKDLKLEDMSVAGSEISCNLSSIFGKQYAPEV
jgi:hypothetical protein